MTPVSGKRLGALVIAATVLLAACGGSAATPSPTTAPTAAPSVAASMAASMAPSVAPSAAAVNCVAGSITAAGSTALQPLVDAAGKQYVTACPASTVSVQGGGSGTGLTQVAAGTVQIGNSDVTAESKLAAADAAKLVDHVVARQGWVMVVNNKVTGVTSLTTKQATDIWTGTTTNWKDVGGPDLPIVLIFRPSSSGTRATFKKIVLGGATEATSGQTLTQDSNGTVTTSVGTTNGATSVIGFSYYQSNKTAVTALGLDGVVGSVDNMVNNTYKLQAFGHMYSSTSPDALTTAFLDYMMSDAVQHTLIPSLFYAPAK